MKEIEKIGDIIDTNTIIQGKDKRLKSGSVVHGNVVDELHDNSHLSGSGSTKETNLSSLGIQGKQIHNLDSSDKNLLGLSLLGKSGSRPVQRRKLLRLLVGKD
eukprot:2881635-Ditylum_brightwellii.AAC.1